jgi:hypothetical protein
MYIIFLFHLFPFTSFQNGQEPDGTIAKRHSLCAGLKANVGVSALFFYQVKF